MDLILDLNPPNKNLDEAARYLLQSARKPASTQPA